MAQSALAASPAAALTQSHWVRVEANRTFGADASGAINQAIVDAANSGGPGGSIVGWKKSGGVVYIPAGHYRIDSTINLKRNVTILGDGPATWLQAGVGLGSGSLISTAGDTAPAAILNLRIDLKNAIGNSIGVELAGFSSSQGWTGDSASYVIRDVYIDNVYTNGGVGIKIDAGCDGVEIRRCWIKGDGKNSNVGIDSAGADVLIKDTITRSIHIGFKTSGSRSRIESSKAFYCGANTAGYAPGFEIHGDDAHLINCESQDNVQGFVMFGQRSILTGCQAEGSHYEQFWVHPGDGTIQSAALLGCQAMHRQQRWSAASVNYKLKPNNGQNGTVANWVATGVSQHPNGSHIDAPSNTGIKNALVLS